MTSSIAPGGSASLPPTPIENANIPSARQAPITPGHRVPVIDRATVDPETLKAAEGMESMFIDYMMKAMRQTVPKNEMDLEGPATDIYRGMLDSEYAEKAAHAGGVGLAEQILAYLQERNAAAPVAHSPSQSYTKDQTTAPQGRVAATTTIRRSP